MVNQHVSTAWVVFAAAACAFVLTLPLLSQAPASPVEPRGLGRVDEGFRDAPGGSGRGWRQVIQDWPENARLAAAAAGERYGEPQEVTGERIVWHRAGPWVRVAVHRRGAPHAFPIPHEDVLEQTIRARVPPDRFDELASFSGSVLPDRTRGELSARCDDERMNVAALSLALDLAASKITVRTAREALARSYRLMAAGKLVPRTQVPLLPAAPEPHDPDRPF